MFDAVFYLVTPKRLLQQVEPAIKDKTKELKAPATYNNQENLIQLSDQGV